MSASTGINAAFITVEITATADGTEITWVIQDPSIESVDQNDIVSRMAITPGLNVALGLAAGKCWNFSVFCFEKEMEIFSQNFPKFFTNDMDCVRTGDFTSHL